MSAHPGRDDEIEPEDEGTVALLFIAAGLIFVVLAAVWLTS